LKRIQKVKKKSPPANGPNVSCNLAWPSAWDSFSPSAWPWHASRGGGTTAPALPAIRRRRVLAAKQLRWSAISARGSYSFARKWGHVRHCGLRRKVAGSGAHQAWGGGGTRNRRRGKPEMRPARSSSGRMVASRGTMERVRTCWSAWSRTGGSRAGSLERLQWRDKVFTRERKQKTGP
jgi:hypothetical protein